MRPLKVKGWKTRRRISVEPLLNHDFKIGDWYFGWNYEFAGTWSMNAISGMGLYITGGILKTRREKVNNPLQLITAIANRTKVTVNYGRYGDSINLVLSQKMVANPKIIRNCEGADEADVDGQLEYLDEDEADEYTEDMRSCAEIEEDHDYDTNVPEDY